jgi:hypothetical protein
MKTLVAYYDLVFLGSACHDADLARPIKEFLERISVSPTFKLAGFVTHASYTPEGGEREQQMLVSSYGAIHEMNLEAGERYTVDTGHLVAFSEGIGFKVHTIGGIKSTMFSGEGLVVDLTGPGRVLLQSRSTDQFPAWLIPQLPFERKGQGN